MVAWESPVVLGHAFYAATALMWLSIGIFAYDTMQYLPFDLAILFGKRQRRWPQLPYIFSKVCMWTYLTSNMVFILTEDEINCHALLQAIEVQMGFIAVSSSVLLAFRAVCVYSGKARKAVSVLLTVMTLGLLAAWMEGVDDIKAAWVAGSGNPWQDGACNFVSMDRRYAVKYVVTIVFDFLVMLLTVVGVIRMNGGSRIGAVLVKQGIQYFAATFIANSLVAGLTLANLNPVMSLCLAIPSATVCVMCSTRLYVHLAEEAKPKPEGVNSSQLSTSLSGSGVEKIARFFKRSSQNPSQVHPTFSLGNTTSSNETAVHGVSSLTYSVKHDGSHSPVEVKSFGMASHDDLESQSGRNQRSPIINIIEERTVSLEPMPAHLAGVLTAPRRGSTDESSPLSDNPYGSVKGQYPRLSKS